ncbi:MAG: putative pterin-4-alpha-carbinolamine dehydratase [Paracidovorax wautersii]|uniref:Putative pterin-4-alpha-carbinolamine dehydratase n=1 Tax=Paracidovorax wautersii TaxID=1177982 RepID=A0A7V8JRB5_9BURK|nr:MAG: putative pterin-4-alpha-carbinolamine dehydratase [Paracidovorax wautersii]
MSSQFHVKDRSGQPLRKASATEVVAHLAQLPGWALRGDGDDVHIHKTFRFADFYQTMAFVNALALVAHRQDHHPDLGVHYNRCEVRLSTHDVQGLSPADFEVAAAIDALLA